MDFMQDDLNLLRERINTLDEQLLQLLNERAATALKIGKVKAHAGTKVYDPDRERAVLEHINSHNEGPLGKGAIEELFAAIITACREIQSN